VTCHLDTMGRIGVRYDLLPWEGDILASRFWEKAFALLQEKNAIMRVESRERAGCWVMALDNERFAELKEAEKIIVRSNGTVTYVGKDIYQLWKFGLPPSDFRYDVFRDEDGGHRVLTSTQDSGRADHPDFGKAERVTNAYRRFSRTCRRSSAKACGPAGAEPGGRWIHYAYEMVALTPKSAERLGVKLSGGDRGRPLRRRRRGRGPGIKADDLLDAIEAEALREVSSRNADPDGAGARLARHRGRRAALP
jgi:arginyl-tRNA synthetase